MHHYWSVENFRQTEIKFDEEKAIVKKKNSPDETRMVEYDKY